MEAYKLETIIPPDRHLKITLPESFPTGAVEIIVLAMHSARSEAEVQDPPNPQTESALERQQSQHLRTRSGEGIEAQIPKERNVPGQ